MAYPTTPINPNQGGDTVASAYGRTNEHMADASQHAPVVEANLQTGTSYTPVLADAGKVVEMNNIAANTLTVPPNSSVAFPVGTVLEVCQIGAGATTIVAGSGVTLRLGGQLRVQYSTASLRKRATDTWICSGDMA